MRLDTTIDVSGLSIVGSDDGFTANSADLSAFFSDIKMRPRETLQTPGKSIDLIIGHIPSTEVPTLILEIALAGAETYKN
jgi:hypothetical protein